MEHKKELHDTNNKKSFDRDKSVVGSKRIVISLRKRQFEISTERKCVCSFLQRKRWTYFSLLKLNNLESLSRFFQAL